MTEVSPPRPDDLLLGIVLADYLLTTFTATVLRRPARFLLGLVFPLIRLVDAVICLVALAPAWIRAH